MRGILTVSSIVFCITWIIAGAQAADPTGAAGAATPTPAASNLNPEADTADHAITKNMKFDDEVVEGMNKNPLDVLESIEGQDQGKNGHLYRKKSDFHPEMKEEATEAGYLP
jgi:hypothetical protein